MTIRELADVLCVSIRTAERKVREMKRETGARRWCRLTVEEAVEYFKIPRYKIERLYNDYKRIMEED